MFAVIEIQLFFNRTKIIINIIYMTKDDLNREIFNRITRNKVGRDNPLTYDMCIKRVNLKDSNTYTVDELYNYCGEIYGTEREEKCGKAKGRFTKEKLCTSIFSKLNVPTAGVSGEAAATLDIPDLASLIVDFVQTTDIDTDNEELYVNSVTRIISPSGYNEVNVIELAKKLGFRNARVGRTLYSRSVMYLVYYILTYGDLETHTINESSIKPSVYNNNDGFFWDVGIRSRLLSTFSEFLTVTPTNTDPNIIKIGQPSVNGFNYLIKYKSGTVTINTVLKTNQNKNSDNLYYEYLVGKCINKLKEYLPNFCYTFGAFIMSPKLKQKLLKNRKQTFTLTSTDYRELTPSIFTPGDLNTNLGTFCEKNNYSSILIEAVKSISFETLIRSDPTDNIPAIGILTNNELVLQLLSIWYQTYITLNACREFYTHNDLHTGNILLYYNDDGIYNIRYFKGDREISSILSKFIPVIIDYGRCYINCDKFSDNLLNANVLNSNNILQNVCVNTKCTPLKDRRTPAFLCGEKHGFMNVKGVSNRHNVSITRVTSDDVDDDFKFYNRDKPNISNDTRLIDYSFYIMNDSPRSEILNSSGKSYVNEFNKLPNELEFWLNKTPGSSDTSRHYFVEEKRDTYITQLSNVTLVFERLHNIIVMDDFVQDMRRYYNGTKIIGEIHIDLDLVKNIIFIPK